MPNVDDPQFIDAMQRIFITRSEVKTIVEYQQRLFASLQELTTNHRVIHDHVRKLTDSHNRVQDDTLELTRTRTELSKVLRELDSSHKQTREDIRQAINAINYMQQEVQKIASLERRLNELERDVKRVWQDDAKDDRLNQEQEQRLRKLERR